ncbi:MAG: DUF4403 family protein [Gammaproteobacteria bacterium]|nr:DUF4403 family protein [Gammaproteobacteria bacterium]
MTSIPAYGRHLLYCAALSLLLNACNRTPEPSIVSERPALLTEDTNATTDSHLSHIGVRARIAYEDITRLILDELPKTHTGNGERRTCKKVVGLKICGTAQWDYTVHRGDDIAVSGIDDTVSVSVPIRFDGVAGLQGDVARALGLSSVDFNGAVDATINLGVDLDASWCPQLTTTIDYEWTQTPRVEWAGALKLDVRKQLDEAIAAQLDELPAKLADSVDCDAFRAQLGEHWRSYTMPVKLEEQDPLHLNLTPTGFAFSGLQADATSLGITFVLDAQTAVESEPLVEQQQPLPAVSTVDFVPGQTEFELLVRSSYSRLQTAAAPALVGKTFHSTTKAGEISATVKSLEISGNPDGITLGIGFDADLPGTSRNTTGTVFLTATPEVDPQLHRVTLTNLSITRVLDSKLWQLLTKLFEERIIDSIKESAVIDLSDHIQDLETEVLAQLNDTDKTEGVLIDAQDLSIQLDSITSEHDALAVLLQARMTLDLLLPQATLARMR